jgi:hypothetical protein
VTQKAERSAVEFRSKGLLLRASRRKLTGTLSSDFKTLRSGAPEAMKHSHRESRRRPRKTRSIRRSGN